MPAVTRPARWAWTVTGLVVAAALAIGLGRAITRAGIPSGQAAAPLYTVTRTVTITSPVTQLSVQSYGAPVQIVTGSARSVQVTETTMNGGSPGGLPAVRQTLSGGRLSLSAPACQQSACSVAFAITVPARATVSAATEGGPLSVYGVAGAVLDSGGGPVRAGQIGGLLTVTADGGSVTLGGTVQAPAGDPGAVSTPGAAATGVTGPLDVDTGGGPLTAWGVASATAVIVTNGGQARIAFSVPPEKATVSTDGGPATLTVPGGPYALTADSDGAPQRVGIATDPAASRSLVVSTSGGLLRIGPAAGQAG